MKRMRLFPHTLHLILFIQLGCMSSGEKAPIDEGMEPSEIVETNEDDSETDEPGSTYVHSLSNNPMTSKVADIKGAAITARKIAEEIKKNNGETIANYESLISSERIARAPVSRLLKHIKRLAEITRKTDQNKKISELARLEIALAAMQQNQYGMAIFLLNDLEKAKNRQVRAGAFNAIANIAARENRIPEAIEFWKQALNADSKYESALFNLGYMSLKFGHFEASKRFLSQIKSDWFSDAGLLVSARLTNDTETASRLCEVLLKRSKPHKPTVFNCGIHEWQSNKNIAKAKQLVGQSLKIPGGPRSWDAQGYRILKAIR